MVEVVAIEPRERLRLELLECKRLGWAKSTVDHFLDALTAKAHLCPRLLGFLPGHDAVVIEVETLEHSIGQLLRLSPRHVLLGPAAAMVPAAASHWGNARRRRRRILSRGLGSNNRRA